MKNILGRLSTLLLTTTLAFVGEVKADTTVQFGIGYRSDDVDWKIDFPVNELPESQSKLWFKDIEIFTVQGRIKSSCDCVYYRIDGEYGWVLDGDVRESDFFSFPVSAVLTPSTLYTTVHPVTHNDIKGKYVADFSVAVGYPLQQCWCSNLQVVPTIGFSYDTQRLRADDHELISDDLTTEELNSLGFETGERGHSTYRSTWWGPFIGVDLAWSCDCWNVYGEFEYHFARARRERNSRTGSHFLDSYRRTRSAYGFNFKVGSIYHFNCNWFLDGHVSFKDFTSNRCHDGISWRSFSIGLDLGYVF